MTSRFPWTSEWGIDLGSANTVICSAAGEILVNEPSVVAINRRWGTVESVGVEAHRAVERNPAAIETTYPVRKGVVTDPALAEQLLRSFLKRINRTVLPAGLNVALAIPGGITDVERFAAVECVRRAGASRVALVDQILAAAHGAGIPLGEPRGAMVIDVGADLVEAGVFSLGEIVVSRAEPVAGNAMDHAIREHVRKNHRLLIGLKTAEEVKRVIGSATGNGHSAASLKVTGRCLLRGLPRSVWLCAGEVREAIAPVIAAIIGVVRSTLEAVPAELSGDLIETGAVLTGGMAFLPGLADCLSLEMQIPVSVCASPTTSVAAGLSKLIRDERVWQAARNLA
ncbi:MAG: rod shape-determining protein [Bryobacteraceae bacterium]|nr:rod shape-determining protein [Bryobacteraceae bacterium]